VGAVWVAVLTGVGLKETHRMQPGGAAAAVLAPYALICCAACALTMLGGVVAGGCRNEVRRARRAALGACAGSRGRRGHAAGRRPCAALDAPPLSLFACPFRAATSLPCLSCGSTHAFAAVAHLHPFEAAAASPLGALAACACAVHALWTALRLCGFRYAPATLAVTLRVRLGAAAMLVLNWAFLVLRGAP